LMRGREAVAAAHDGLTAALADRSPYVRIAAAEALGQYGGEADLKRALETLVELGPMDKNGVFVSVAALNAIDDLGPKAAPVWDAVKKFPQKGELPNPRYAPFVPRLISDIGRGG